MFCGSSSLLPSSCRPVFLAWWLQLLGSVHLGTCFAGSLFLTPLLLPLVCAYLLIVQVCHELEQHQDGGRRVHPADVALQHEPAISPEKAGLILHARHAACLHVCSRTAPCPSCWSRHLHAACGGPCHRWGGEADQDVGGARHGLDERGQQHVVQPSGLALTADMKKTYQRRPSANISPGWPLNLADPSTQISESSLPGAHAQ